MQLWPVHPHPLPDELLSSWMIRLARANGFKVHNFCALFFGRDRQIWTRDIDHHAPAWLTDRLAELSGTTPERIHATTLRAYESILFERFVASGANQWVLPLGVFHRSRRGFGQQFCGRCLAEDPEPYLRRAWRLAVVVICVRHQVMLEDRCQACGKSLAPHRADMVSRAGFPERTDLSRCAYCRVKLDGATTPATAEGVKMQRAIDAVLQTGCYLLEPNRPVYSHLYFDGIRMLMNIVPREHPAGVRYPFELADVSERARRLIFATHLAEDWPQNLRTSCAPLRHVYTTIVCNIGNPPYWLDATLRREFFQGRALASEAEAQAIAQAIVRSGAAATSASMRALSGRDMRHLLPSRLVVSDEQADRLIARLQEEIVRASRLCTPILRRDLVMFQVARLQGLTAPELLALTVEDLCRKRTVFTFLRNRPDNAVVTLRLLRSYLRQVRPLFIGADGSALFLTLEGRPLTRTALGMRFQKALLVAKLQHEIRDWTEWVRGPW